MRTLTIKELLDDIKSIDTTEPGKNEDTYFPWHRWRIRMVGRAFKMLAARIAARGYEVIFADRYLIANINGYSFYVQYNELLHFYETRCDERPCFQQNEDMVIVSSWKEIEDVMMKNVRAEDFNKRTEWMRNSDSHIYVTK